MNNSDLCRQLWGRVLLQVIRDLLDLTPGVRSARHDAERWIGTFPSSEFRQICDLAGLEPDAAFPWFRKLCATPLSERRALIDVNIRGGFLIADTIIRRYAS